jgi:alpha-mannosidase
MPIRISSYLLGSGKPAVGGPQYASAAPTENVPLVAATANASGPTEVRISIKENGPLLASLLVESKADGCNKLLREVRLIAGQPQVEIDNLVDKIATTTKEGVHFGFAFNITNPRTRVDIPWGVMELEADQLPFANRNWICFQRWLDISNSDCGVTWCALDAATFESGAMTANIIGSGTGSPAWIRKLQPSATIYSWALNNHWHTNFPLFQEGKIPFRYRLLPHVSGYDAAAANRFGVEQAQPLLATPAKDDLEIKTRVAIDNPRVYATILKTTADGKAVMVRLRSLSDQPETASLGFPSGAPRSIRMSDATEVPGEITAPAVTLLPYGITTLRLEFNH